MSDKTVREVLDERGLSYGSFKGYAEKANAIKKILKKNSEGSASNPVALEAMDMVVSKLCRLANGDLLHRDSWVDIAGYAQLVVDELK